MQKAALFVDGSNMLYAERLLNWKIDWLRFRRRIEAQFELVSARFYLPYREPVSDDLLKFYSFLINTGYSLKKKKVKEITDKETGQTIYKGNLDIELVVDALTATDHYDVMILCSGDGDFVPLLQALKNRGKAVHAYSTRGISAMELVTELGMHFNDVTDIREEIEYVERPAAGERAPTFLRRLPDGKTLPEPGTTFRARAQAVKPYGIFLQNEWNLKVLLHVSRLGLGATRIPDLTPLIRPEDEFSVTVVELQDVDGEQRITVELSDPDMSAAIIDRFRGGGEAAGPPGN